MSSFKRLDKGPGGRTSQATAKTKLAEEERPSKLERLDKDAKEILATKLGLNASGFVPELTFKVKSESTEELDVVWVCMKVKDKDDKVLHAEGKLYIPKNLMHIETKGLVVFQPGLPGGGAILFEQNQVEELVKEGFTVLVLRNNGLNTESQKGRSYTRCDERAQRKSAVDNGEVLGLNKNWSYYQSAREVEVAVRSLESAFGKIHIICHSYGGLATFASLAHLESKLAAKLENVVFESPLLAKPQILDGEVRWGEKPAANRRSTTVTTLREIHEWMFSQGIYVGKKEDATARVAELLKLSEDVHDDKLLFLSTVKRILFLNPNDDEYIEYSGVNAVMARIPKSVQVTGLVYTETEGGTKKLPEGIEAHDMPSRSAEEFIQLFKGKRPMFIDPYGHLR